MWVKPYQSVAFLQSQLKWVLCTQNLFTKCKNSSHIFMQSRNLPSVLSVTDLQEVRNMLLYPLEANLLGNRGIFWLISWSHKGHCYEDNYLQHFSWKWLLETNCSFKSNFDFLLKRKKPQKNKAQSFCWTIGYCIFLELIPVNTTAGVMKLYMPEKGW